ncbi:tRNA (adenosine(37)-N6)-threonylcarbamoyltransferase complex dimerization subunit type 1 TsaB [Gayadomonas joobiniege]|uniref:tRNA (adenosine(37)-N6)-threonylcarbamoyltransferase complex dimerization subunit type 1 TsaB n=1 Tax=Gayadomonas joobiniege TaxID=1234606 RepID=UPI00036B02D1|nr:tRNA (adenosine(37)-N6)-threonylcarbamoyltransferase complex dimerization subunit type 1 TsaB [Gayadomonas joobiniege]
MKTILALDTSTEACSAAVLTPTQFVSEFEVCPREHNQKLLPMAEAVLQQAGISLQEVDYIVYGQGPGSFTGVRIATGIVQGLALGSDKPTLGMSSLLAMAYAVFKKTGQTRVIAAIDARMGEIYLAAIEFNEAGMFRYLIDECVCAPEQALDALDKTHSYAAVGTGWHTYETVLTSQINADINADIYLPDAASMAELAKLTATPEQLLSAAEVSPVYIRDKVTWQKLPGK